MSDRAPSADQTTVTALVYEILQLLNIIDSLTRALDTGMS